MSLVAPTTRLTGITDAAARRDALLGHDDHADTVYLTAHRAPWRIYRIPVTGWLARRVDDDRRDIPEATGWLGIPELDPGHVVSNLLDLPELATDFFNPQTWLPTAHPWDDAAQPWYARCPHPTSPTRLDDGGCGFTGPTTPCDPASHDPRHRLDLTKEVAVRCWLCHHTFDGRPQAVPATSHVTCPCCDTQIPAPVEAVHYWCPACGWRFFDHSLPTRWYTHLLHRTRTAAADGAGQ